MAERPAETSFIAIAPENHESEHLKDADADAQDQGQVAPRRQAQAPVPTYFIPNGRNSVNGKFDQ